MTATQESPSPVEGVSGALHVRTPQGTVSMRPQAPDRISIDADLVFYGDRCKITGTVQRWTDGRWYAVEEDARMAAFSAYRRMTTSIEPNDPELAKAANAAVTETVSGWFGERHPWLEREVSILRVIGTVAAVALVVVALLAGLAALVF